MDLMPMHKEFIGPLEIVFMTVAFIPRSHRTISAVQEDNGYLWLSLKCTNA